MKLYDDLMYRGLIKDVSTPLLEKLLNEGGITFYFGTDPTDDSLHIGHYSSLLMVFRLLKGGHNPIILLGGATGLIGDPKPTAERTIVSKDFVLKNIESLEKQIKGIFPFDKYVNNIDWSKEINFIDFLRDFGKYFSVNYMLDKDIVSRRLETGITYTEFSYMIMQALDFEYLFTNNNCTMQVAGSDQWGNITAGIDLIRKKHQKEVYGFTMPLLTDKYGNKFGKTEGNAVWLDKNKTSSYEMYQYLFNSDDEVIIDYLKKLTLLTKEEIEEIERKHFLKPEDRLAQITLAKEIITMLHGEDEFIKAKEISEKLFSDKVFELSSEEVMSSLKGIPNFKIDELNIEVNEFLVKYEICTSKREVREMIESGAIYINNKKITDYNYLVNPKDGIEEKVFIIRKGKKKYYLGII